MTARTRPPFRADHVGSLLRPPELLQAIWIWSYRLYAVSALSSPRSSEGISLSIPGLLRLHMLSLIT